MTLHDAQTLAKDLMWQHGLTQAGWSFKFDRSVSRFGVCRYNKKIRRFGVWTIIPVNTISLSAPLTVRNGEAEVKDTILHEIAHAIAGHKAGHGLAWKVVAARIGARPIRCYESAKVEQPKGKYTCTCKHCGASFPVYKVTRKIRQLILENEGKIPAGRSCYHPPCGRTLGRLTIEPTK